MFLTREELIELSGGRRPSSICAWLDGEGIRYALGRDRWPRVLRSVILVRLGNATQANHEPRLHLA
ncbi:MAG: DUF4224 domain-containing protein [Azonexus sp.]|nr:DUF4224 domain-containing protein [Azonexus sp.]